MGNHILTEKQREENCNYMWQKLENCINNNENYEKMNISFPNSGIGILQCKKYDSYGNFVKNTGYTADFFQRDTTVYIKNTLKTSSKKSHINIILEDDTHDFYFS